MKWRCTLIGEKIIYLSLSLEGFPPLEASNEQEAVENECSDLMSGMDLQQCQEEIQQDIHILTNGQVVPDMVEVAQDEAQSQKEDAQRRGIKRKRNDDDDDGKNRRIFRSHLLIFFTVCCATQLIL